MHTRSSIKIFFGHSRKEDNLLPKPCKTKDSLRPQHATNWEIICTNWAEHLLIWEEHSERHAQQSFPTRCAADQARPQVFNPGGGRKKLWPSWVKSVWRTMNGWFAFWVRISQVGKSCVLCRNWKYLYKIPHCTCRDISRQRAATPWRSNETSEDVFVIEGICALLTTEVLAVNSQE